MTTAILWFRRDLRLHYNPALNWVLDNCTRVIPVYISAAAEEKPWQLGAASRWWLHHSLVSLDTDLQKHGLKLHFFSGDSAAVLAKIIDKTAANALVFNRLYEPYLYQRDQQLEQQLTAKVKIKAFDSALFFEPGQVLNNQQRPYRVFTPFYKKLRPLLDEYDSNHIASQPIGALNKLASAKIDFAEEIESLDLLDNIPWHLKLHHHWRPGEENAFTLLNQFLDDSVAHYKTERDIPSAQSTSRMSPYLHFGEITPRQIFFSLLPLLKGGADSRAIGSAEVFVKQLVWREFAHNVLWHFPHTSTDPMDTRFDKSFWRTSAKDLDAWQKGQTGIPLVDAGMKQLWETGWMHNRVRMIVSSFLTKNLGLHWLAGARWFWDTLVDANLANNSMGWQWVAGCGVDAAPYYRIFNPETQSSKFDANNRYINKWLPDNAEPGYPEPIVDLAESRKTALQKYKMNITGR